jgi:hypothetical protein
VCCRLASNAVRGAWTACNVSVLLCLCTTLYPIINFRAPIGSRVTRADDIARAAVDKETCVLICIGDLNVQSLCGRLLPEQCVRTVLHKACSVMRIGETTMR